MNLLRSLLEPIIQPALDKASAVIPMHWQIKGAHAFQGLKQRAGRARPIPVFRESPLPEVSTLALRDIDVSNPFLYRQGLWHSYFKRLRDECPVHYQSRSPFGPFWSVTRYEDIMYVDTHHDLFSAEPIISIGPQPEGLELETFIAMDPPKHDVQRQAVQGVVAPKNLAQMESLIRSRTADVLNRLPVNEPFDWVQKVSIDLTSRMLATLLDFPLDQRHKLAYWSDVAASPPEATGGLSNTDEAFDVAADMARTLSLLWREKEARLAAGGEPGFDLISLLLTNDNTRTMINRPMEFMGNMVLLIVGGNDTTRNSMTGGVLALNQFPGEFDKLRQNPALIPNMVSEIIRWQTPLAYMRRVAKQDVTLNGATISKGDKVVMWYASGNRDERAFDEDPDRFIIDRKNARKHLSFGFGVHRCMGNRLAEMQLRILWEEILKRFAHIEVLEEPGYVQSNFVRGYTRMQVKVTAKT
ncbi:MAG: cytochrome P450 [Marinobacter sp.]|uniref:cytochrome P450 n=1 Tax=Marinobacter sp. TaxID=50741 RepID=UPI003C6A665B